jgi:hypothetical protein
MAALSDDQLNAIVSNQIAQAKSYDKNSRATPRAKALDYFLGNMDSYVPPEANRSKVVSRDVADTISRMLPGIIRVFTASGRMAIAEPVSTEDEPFADQASDGMNYVFWKDNKGYEIVYNATWDALLHGNGVVKTYYDDTPVYTTSFHSGLVEDQVALLLQDESTEVLAQTQRPEVMEDPETGEPIQVMLYDLKIKRKKADGSFVVTVIPTEEFLIDSDAIATDEAAFTDHWQKKTRSDLVAMGYDKETVWKIPEAARTDTPEEQARRLFATGDAVDKSMQLVDYHEAFVRVDVDDDGEAELIRHCSGGPIGEVHLDWEVWEDEHPFDDIPCEPIPHRWEARSVADETIDIQDVKTVLTRQFLNGTYWQNNPQRFAVGKIKNPDQLDNPTFGGTVFGDTGSMVTNLEVGDVGDTALRGLAYMDEVREARTGVSRQSMALDPEALQNQTAEAVRSGKDSSYAQTELVARNMAEWGWSKVFRKLMRLMIKHQDEPRQVMLNSKKQITIDPRFWNADMNVTVNVGLGTGTRDRDLAMLGQVLQTQLGLADRFMQSGAASEAIDMLPKIIATMTKMAESAGIRNPEDYYPEFTEDKVKALKEMASQPKPDPALALEEAKGKVTMQVEQGKGEVAKELKNVDAQVSMQQAQLKAQGDVVKNQAELDADLQTKDADRQHAIAIENVKQQGAMQIESMRIASAERIKAAELAQQREIETARMANAAHIASLKPPPSGKPAN